MPQELQKVHVFTDAPEAAFLKQFPGNDGRLDGFSFSFGLDVPKDCDALIAFNRASYTIATTLPKARTAFIAAEPDAIHPYSARYLNQFGIVLSATDKPLGTRQWKTAPCWYWFAGIDFSKPWEIEHFRGYDYFSNLAPPPKRNKVSVVTSNKSFTEYHQKRIAFLDALIEKIPEHLEIYGRGHKSVDDKRLALEPCKYHIALENSHGPDTWTEKLADPYLCWAYPFYAGATNVEEYFPALSFSYLDLDDPRQAAEQIVQAVQSGLWDRERNAIATARQTILTEQNIAHQLVHLARDLTAQPAGDRSNILYLKSERSLWPEKGARGSVGQWALRNTLMLFDKGIELRTAGLRDRLDAAKTRRRQRKLRKLENK
ncbi:glycosyltransferase family 10 domain-containing protein [Shimia sp. FJ5]|uniref:glycosyltransferase family 10 domain-containing protein n=1 Tax=Shimia sp. FJ5 TaxID=3079054 RepID=UPI00262D6B27|nr:glycosyltransferase family 10 [Shimia sp. FJ5]MDV4145921.1 glycosyltransferase family 10 [Shimia sp. FJ5]